jgi:hypothetical protein
MPVGLFLASLCFIYFLTTGDIRGALMCGLLIFAQTISNEDDPNAET